MEYIRNIILNLVKINRTWDKVENIDLSIEENLDKTIQNIHTMDSTEIERLVRKIELTRMSFSLY